MPPIRVLLFAAQRAHRKIAEAIPRMCTATGCDLEMTESLCRVKTGDYDLLVSPLHYIDPSVIPANVRTIIGPQLYVFPSGPTVGPYDASYEGRYIVNCLSEWVKEHFRAHVGGPGALRFPNAPLPTGVDTGSFAPNGAERTKVLLYIKHRKPSDIAYMRTLLAQKNIAVEVFDYGSYNEANYLRALQSAQFMVVLDAHESQGYALQEAMSCGVPLLVWDVESMYQEYNGGRQVYSPNGNPLTATSVPWWSDECGIQTTKQEELADALDVMVRDWSTYKPREFVLATLSDKVCMERWLSAVGLSC